MKDSRARPNSLGHELRESHAAAAAMDNHHRLLISTAGIFPSSLSSSVIPTVLPSLRRLAASGETKHPREGAGRITTSSWVNRELLEPVVMKLSTLEVMGLETPHRRSTMVLSLMETPSNLPPPKPPDPTSIPRFAASHDHNRRDLPPHPHHRPNLVSTISSRTYGEISPIHGATKTQSDVNPSHSLWRGSSSLASPTHFRCSLDRSLFEMGPKNTTPDLNPPIVGWWSHSKLDIPMVGIFPFRSLGF
ncbi:hypothetical protein AALP_AA5G272000 [Arabis alpina]|uniref:Uncharacterized protein n=1 Tax=Arabis alpina TaxID=50452 RepID=A0A087GZN7_ARAAL|nr:hypothetical protein AALP_AA5G272000 [Arabis alpina]